MNQTFTFTFDTAETTLLITALAKLPLEVSYALFGRIQQEAQKQAKPAGEPEAA